MESGTTARLQAIPGAHDVAVGRVRRGRCAEEGIAQVALGGELDHEVTVLVNLSARLAVLHVHVGVQGSAGRQDVRGAVVVAPQWGVSCRQGVGDRCAAHLLVNVHGPSHVAAAYFSTVSDTRYGALGAWNRYADNGCGTYATN
jgi:hypothetical protein